MWDVASKQARVIKADQDSTRSAAFSADGRRVVTASADGSMTVWDADTGQILTSLNGYHAALNRAAFGNDGKQVVFVTDKGAAFLWEIDGNQRITPLNNFLCVEARDAAFSPDGRVIGIGCYGSVVLVNAIGSDELQTKNGPIDSRSIAFSPNGKRVLTAAGRDAWLWDLATGRQVGFLPGHSTDLISVAFSPDGQSVVTTSEDGTAILWKVFSNAAELISLVRQGMRRELSSEERVRFFLDVK